MVSVESDQLRRRLLPVSSEQRPLLCFRNYGFVVLTFTYSVPSAPLEDFV